jgi:Cys-tRNA(Pro)/Cys-tRNA(Cys) deacylase
MKKMFPTFIDETAKLHQKIFVSAGMRGMQINISPDNLVLASNAHFADLI